LVIGTLIIDYYFVSVNCNLMFVAALDIAI